MKKEEMRKEDAAVEEKNVPVESNDKPAEKGNKKKYIIAAVVLALLCGIIFVSCNGCGTKKSEPVGAITVDLLDAKSSTAEYGTDATDLFDLIEIKVGNEVLQPDPKNDPAEDKNARAYVSADGTQYIVTVEPGKLTPNDKGKAEVKYTITKKDAPEEEATPVTVLIDVKDTQAPVIEFKKDTVSVALSSEFKPADNIKSVSDPVDGPLSEIEAGKEKKGTGYYTITSNVDTSKEGEYEVKVDAKDKNGNDASKNYKVTVKKE